MHEPKHETLKVCLAIGAAVPSHAIGAAVLSHKEVNTG
jgi:hypothetical protein